jgi:hypothetical protein
MDAGSGAPSGTDGGGGVIWFLRESYKFVSPRGFCEHLHFLAYLPRAAYIFWNPK